MHFDPKTQSVMRILILVAALSMHAIFEGLVFGLARGQPAELFGTIAAVLIHKSIIAFSTGMQLLSSQIPERFDLIVLRKTVGTPFCDFSLSKKIPFNGHLFENPPENPLSGKGNNFDLFTTMKI